MIEYIKGDITQETSGMVLHSVNAQAVMGGGVALAIRNKWPQVYRAYMSAPQGAPALGNIQVIQISKDLFVCNLWGQEYFGNDGARYADIGAIESGLRKALSYCVDNSITELKMPRIGALRGGLDWDTELVPLITNLTSGYPEVKIKIIDIN